MAQTDTRYPQNMRRWITSSMVAAGALASVACTVMAPRDSPLPREGATMSDIYRNHLHGAGDANAETAGPRDRLPLRGADDDAVVAERRALSEPLKNRFERLPNPDLTLHVFPHLAQGRYPVPGYDTVFAMYETVQFAMPGEVAPRHKVGASFTYPVPTTGKLAATEDKASSDTLSKTERLTLLERISPVHARVLVAYDQLYAQRCGTSLSSEQLMAVPASAAPAFDRMMRFAAVGRDNDGLRVAAELMRCDAPAHRAAADVPARAVVQRKEPS